MLRGEAHRLLRLDENNVEEDLDLPFVTPLSLQQRNGRENDYGRFADDEPSRWSRTQLSRHIGASVVRLFGRVRSLLCTTSTRTAFIIGFLMFTLCFVICTAKLLSTSEPYPRPEARKDEIPQGVPVENSIFKVGSLRFKPGTILIPLFVGCVRVRESLATTRPQLTFS